MLCSHLPSAALRTLPWTSLPSGKSSLGSFTKESDRWPILTRASALRASTTNTPALLTDFTYPETCVEISTSLSAYAYQACNICYMQLTHHQKRLVQSSH